MIVSLVSKTFHIHPGCAVCFCREGGEDGDSQGDGSSQPDTISIASRTSQNTVDSDKVGNTVAEHLILTSWRPTAVSALQGFLCSLNEQQQGLGMLTVWSVCSVHTCEREVINNAARKTISCESPFQAVCRHLHGLLPGSLWHQSKTFCVAALAVWRCRIQVLSYRCFSHSYV